MNKHLISAAVGSVLSVVATTQVVGPLLAQESETKADLYQQLDLFGLVFERIRSEYVEEVDEGELIEAAINGMLSSLDPHSSYLPPSAFEDMRIDSRGEFGGLGIEVTQEEGYVKVITPMDDTPAADAGIEAGDFIVAVDNESLLGLALTDAVDLMRGPVGSDITLTILREGLEEPLELVVTRDIIKISSARVRQVGDAIVARVSSFTDQTYPNLKDGLAKSLEEAGGLDSVNGVVLDLRNNPGGLLDAGVDVTDAFLNQGEIVSTRGRNPEEGIRFNAKDGDLIEGKPLVVLINSGSASASEIVAGALQDHGRAVVVGTNSFGKGSVQSILPVQGDGAMRLTTARYYTPSGRSIQALGVAPDIIVAQPRRDPNAVEEETDELPRRSEANLRGSLSNEDNMSEDEIRQAEEEQQRVQEAAELREQDYQLAYAIDILRGLNALGPQD